MYEGKTRIIQVSFKMLQEKEILKYTKIKQFKTKNPSKTAQFIYADFVLIIIFNIFF